MDFYRRKKAQLIGLRRKWRSHGWHRLDDTAALLQDSSNDETGDGSLPFRFLDLPPELRLLVYEESTVLRFQYFDACQPQILASCKAVNQEASSVLYERNEIIIRICEAGVTAHNTPCGRYVPAQQSVGMAGRVVDFTTIVWPKFLRRMRWLYISIPQVHWFRPCGTLLYFLVPPSCRKASIDNVIYSLSTKLRGKHHERLYVRTDLGIRVPEDIKAAFYSTRFLGLKGISEDFLKRSGDFSFPNRYIERLVTDLRAPDPQAKICFLRYFAKVLKYVACDYNEPKIMRLAARMLSFTVMWSARAVGKVDPDTGGHCYDSDKVFTNTVKFAITELRILLETTDMSDKHPLLKAQVLQLLWLDIHLRTTPTTGKGEDTARNSRLLEGPELARAFLFCPHMHQQQ